MRVAAIVRVASAMSASFVVDVASDGRAPALPDACVACAAPATTTSTLALERLVATPRGGQVRRALRWAVPHCETCARLTKSTFLAGFVPFAIGFVVVGAASFMAAAWGTIVTGLDDASTQAAPRTPASLVLGGLAGLVGGVAGGFVAELIGRLVLLPFLGRALLQTPLLVPSLFTDADHVAGLTATPDTALETVVLRFTNGAVAGQFAQLNPDARRAS